MGAKFGTDLKPITIRTMVNYQVKLIRILFSQFGTRYVFFFFFVSSDSGKHFKKSIVSILAHVWFSFRNN